MGDPPAAAAPMPCCVYDAPNGKHCTKCKSRHYCSKACQLVDWKRGHNKACKQLAAEFQDALMPAKLKIKEEPPIVEDVAPAALKAAARLSAVRADTTLVEASAPNDDSPDWRGTCAICLDELPLEADRQMFFSCCCKKLCTACGSKCLQHDNRCPLCRVPTPNSAAEVLRRMQKHVDEGRAEAQFVLGEDLRLGARGLQESPERSFSLYEHAAAQGHAKAQDALGLCYVNGYGVEINHEAAALCFRRGADQGYPYAQTNLGCMFYDGKGVAQSHDEAVKWYRLAAAQGHPDALYNLGGCLRRRRRRATGRRRGAAPLQARRGKRARRRRSGGR
jgi:TPR repeat protein